MLSGRLVFLKFVSVLHISRGESIKFEMIFSICAKIEREMPRSAPENRKNFAELLVLLFMTYILFKKHYLQNINMFHKSFK